MNRRAAEKRKDGGGGDGGDDRWDEDAEDDDGADGADGGGNGAGAGAGGETDAGELTYLKEARWLPLGQSRHNNARRRPLELASSRT